MNTLLFLGKIGFSEVLVLILLIVLLFGAKKIPEIMKGMGRGVKEFKDAVNQDYTAKGPEKKPGETVEAPKAVSGGEPAAAKPAGEAPKAAAPNDTPQA